MERQKALTWGGGIVYRWYIRAGGLAQEGAKRGMDGHNQKEVKAHGMGESIAT